MIERANICKLLIWQRRNIEKCIGNLKKQKTKKQNSVKRKAKNLSKQFSRKETQMVNKYAMPLTIREIQIKAKMRYRITLPPLLERLLSKEQKVTHNGEDVQKGELLRILGRNAN